MKCSSCGTDNPDVSRFCAGCGRRLPLSSDPAPLRNDGPDFTRTIAATAEGLAPGEVFAGRYRIVESLGEGGMGRVYRAFDATVGEEVALKLIHPDIAADPRIVRRFAAELKLARRIGHRNVGRMFELLDDRGTPFITMEYIPGEDLKSFLRRVGRLPSPKAVSIAREVAEGLAEAHALGVVHRDLKPSNVMIDKSGTARILDFGIARTVAGAGLTTEGTAVGTPEYMSPEQAEGRGIDARTDIYALGVLLFEMLAGRRPFRGDTPVAVALDQRAGAPPDLKGVDPALPDALAVLVRRCLDPDREARPGTIQEVIEALRSIEADWSAPEIARGAVSAPGAPASAADRPRSPGRRFIIPAAAVAGAAVIVLLVMPRLRPTGGGPGPEAAPAQASGAPVESPSWTNSIAVLPFRDFSASGDQEHFCDGMTDAVILRLARLDRSLKVTSLQSVMAYKNRDRSLREIGRELGVRTILEGTVQKEDGRIRVSAQLIDVEDDAHVWQNRYESRAESVFDLQDEISASIAGALQIELSPGSVPDMQALRPRNMEAYDDYVKGMHFLKSKYILTFEENDFRMAERMFSRAAERDPEYALACYGLAWAHEHHYYITDDPEDRAKAVVYATRSYELDPGLAQTNALMGYIRYAVDDDIEGAVGYFRRALEIDPNQPETNFLVGVVLQYFGLYDPAVRYLERAMDLDPYYFWNPYKLGMCFLDLGNLELSERYFDRYFEVAPQAMVFPGRFITLLVRGRDFDRARERIERDEALAPGAEWLDKPRALLAAAQGDADGALALDRSSEVYALLGRTDEAIAALKTEIRPDVHPAYLAHPYLYYRYLLHNGFYDSLRSDPRFQAILAAEKTLYDEYARKFGDL